MQGSRRRRRASCSARAFEDADLAGRDWYDGTKFRIVGDATAGKGCIEYEWPDRQSGVQGSSPVRRLFEPTDEVSIRFYLKLSKGWGWSGQNFHPHLTHFLTTENPKWHGPAASHLTLYIEPVGGKLRLAAQDIQNKDMPHGLTQGPLKGGYNGKFYDSQEVLFKDDQWHCVEAYFKLNTLDLQNDRPNRDGIVRGWFDGKLVVEHTDVVLRSTDFPKMKFNQFLMAPYFGPGLLPHAQKLWIDELAVGTKRIGPLPVFTGEEFCKTRDPKVYNPPQLDVAGWVAAFKAAGMKYAVLTTRHTSGFLLWDSATTDFDVASSGNTTDVCKEFVNECRRQGLVPAFYYCLWGGKDWKPNPNARAIILAQLYELATQYGEIPYFWIDMKNWAPADLSTQEIYDGLKTLQPNCVVEFNQHVQDGTKIAYFPTDVVDGELTPPPASGPQSASHGRRQDLLPARSTTIWSRRAERADTTTIRSGRPAGSPTARARSFTPSHPFPAEAVAKQIRLGWKRGAANVLLATAPDHTGRMRPEDVEQLRRLGRILRGEEPPSRSRFRRGCRATASSVWENNPEWGPDKAVDGDSETRWGGGVGTKQGWLELDLGSDKRFDSV